MAPRSGNSTRSVKAECTGPLARWPRTVGVPMQPGWALTEMSGREDGLLPYANEPTFLGWCWGRGVIERLGEEK